MAKSSNSKTQKKLPKRAGQNKEYRARRRAIQEKRKAIRREAQAQREAVNREKRANGILTPWEEAKVKRAERRA